MEKSIFFIRTQVLLEQALKEYLQAYRMERRVGVPVVVRIGLGRTLMENVVAR